MLQLYFNKNFQKDKIINGIKYSVIFFNDIEQFINLLLKQLFFSNSDFTWILFSDMWIRCVKHDIYDIL